MIWKMVDVLKRKFGENYGSVMNTVNTFHIVTIFSQKYEIYFAALPVGTQGIEFSHGLSQRGPFDKIYFLSRVTW